MPWWHLAEVFLSKMPAFILFFFVLVCIKVLNIHMPSICTNIFAFVHFYRWCLHKVVYIEEAIFVNICHRKILWEKKFAYAITPHFYDRRTENLYEGFGVLFRLLIRKAIVLGWRTHISHIINFLCFIRLTL